MGSLTAGWDSLTIDPNKVRLERNRSLTKEEIEAFKKARKASHQSHEEQQRQLEEETKSRSKPQTPPISPRFVHRGAEYAVDVDKAYKSGDWWTRSNWAFLNEPAVTEEQRKKSLHNYRPQFHVAAAGKSTLAN